MTPPTFSPAYAAFFRELAANNHKAWFDAHKEEYEREARQPFLQLVEFLRLGLIPLIPQLEAYEARQLIFRINRDVRFSKDKSPYKTHLAAAFSPQGKSAQVPGFYLQLGAEGIWVGGGCYELDKDSLFRVRQEISYHLDEFAQVVGDPAFVDAFGEIKGERNKKLPPEFQQDAQTQPLLANKQFYFMRELPPEAMTDPDLASKLLAWMQAGAAFNAFLLRAFQPA